MTYNVFGGTLNLAQSISLGNLTGSPSVKEFWKLDDRIWRNFSGTIFRHSVLFYSLWQIKWMSESYLLKISSVKSCTVCQIVLQSIFEWYLESFLLLLDYEVNKNICDDMVQFVVCEVNLCYIVSDMIHIACYCVYFVCFCFILHIHCITVSMVVWTWWDWCLILRTPSSFSALTLLVGSFDS